MAASQGPPAIRRPEVREVALPLATEPAFRPALTVKWPLRTSVCEGHSVRGMDMGARGATKMIPKKIIDRLVCSECGRPVDEVGEGKGTCCPEGHLHLMRDGYLDCAAPATFGGTTERTLASFGFEWNNFDDVREEDAGFADVYFRDVDLAGLAGK